MSIKNELRKVVKAERKQINNRAVLSKEIQNNLTRSKFYSTADKILCYYPINNEVETFELMQRAMQDGKTLALPKCVDDKGTMKFYSVCNLDKDLVDGLYGIREPNTKCAILKDFSNSIIVVPGLCFDKRGYRLGYGKGYYDRFLEKHSLISVGLCYNSLVKNEIPIDRYDLPVDFIITEKQIISCKMED